MNWRDTLGVPRPPGSSYTHNSQNTQNSVDLGNCADIADSASRVRKMDEPRLHNGLARSSIGAERKGDTDALRRLILTRVLLSPPKPARGRVREPDPHLAGIAKDLQHFVPERREGC